MNGIDCASKLNAASAQALKSAGILAAGRYLGGNYGLTIEEVKAIHAAGMALWLIFESNPTQRGYFTYNQGLADAKRAITEANKLSVPDGVAIYFTVDYDAQASDFSAIIDYFKGVKDGLGGKFLMGVYGSYTVIQNIKADRYFQTYAWSPKGKQAPNHIYQYSNDVTLAGVAIDKDYVNENAGLWIEEENDVLNAAVVLYTEADKEAGFKVAARNGNCAIFVRNADHSAPKEAMTAKKLFVIGGGSLNHPNETLLTGNSWAGTAYAVGKYLGDE